VCFFTADILPDLYVVLPVWSVFAEQSYDCYLFQPKVIASYDFKPQETEELELKRGDIISVLDKKDPNWWMGEIVRGTQTFRGLFPKTYVSPYTD